MTRPRKSEIRDMQLNLSLTADEFEKILRRAAALSMRPSHFGRTVLLDEKWQIAEQRTAPTNHSRLVYQLARLGNNLNQMVRHLHRTGDRLPPDLDPLLADIRRAIAGREEI